MSAPAATALPVTSAPQRPSRWPTAAWPFAPLVPVALAATAGIVLDRYLILALSVLLVGLGLAFALLLWTWVRPHWRLSFWLLLLNCGLLGATWHHVRHQPSSNDLQNLPMAEVPLARVRGIVLDTRVQPRSDDPLRSQPREPQTVLLLEVMELAGARDRIEVSGRCRVSLPGQPVVAVGDEIEVVGELHRLLPPGNPGEADIEAWFHDQGIGAVLRGGSVQVLQPSTISRLDVGLARIRHWAGQQLDLALAPDQAALALALLLGEASALGAGQFADFQRTGVYHILAISGQHLAILSAIFWPALRLLPLPRGQRALLLGLTVLFYALLTGGRAPILRAAVMVCTFCGGMMLRRPVSPLNSLALAWLLVLMINPADVFQTGCLISFLCVLVLLEVIAPLERAWRDRDPMDRLIEQARPYWQQALRASLRWLLLLVIAGAVLWVLVTPLTAARFHLISPAAIALGPPLVLLSSLALLAGFLFLLVSPLGPLVSWPFAWLMQLGLDGCARVVQWGEQMPLAYMHTAGPPEWWVLGFYGGLLSWILVPGLLRRWHVALLLGLAWLVVLLALPGHRAEPGTLRCTVLAVGHGSCAVIEMPDGRVLLYDTGSIRGPEVTERQIAPFLWERRIQRIDEVFLSHADLDHFNGLPALMERFPIGQVSVTPTFFAKDERGVNRVADDLAKRGASLRVLSAGQVMRAGDVQIDVLHPPEQGPEGTENARSLVLLFRYADRTLLLTGDLEEPGLGLLQSQQSPQVDVLLAPHHGSATSNTERFAEWAKPRLVIASEGRERGRRADPYAAQGAELWRTSQVGAVTIRLTRDAIHAETFLSQQVWQSP